MARWKRSPDRATLGYRVEFEWRGETAYYIEGDRRVWMSTIYWGGRAGSVSHVAGVWELPDGQRVPLTDEERALVLQRVIDCARLYHNIPLEIANG